MNDAVQPQILPSKEQIKSFPLFQNLAFEQIHVIHCLRTVSNLGRTTKYSSRTGF